MEDLKSVRLKLGLTQAELAEKLQVNPNYVSMIERGAKTPSKRLQQSIAALVEASNEGAPRSILKLAREAAGMTLKNLAKATGYGVGYIQALEDNGARLSEKFAEKAAEALGIEKENLMGGSDHPPVTGETAGMVGEKPNVKTIGDINLRYVPLISWSQAGAMTDFTDEVYDYEGHLAADIRDPKAIAVRIRGDSMQPRFHEGDVAVLSPSTTPQTGDLVIARIKDQGVVFKRLQIAGKKYQFISLNERYPMLEFDGEDIVWVYPVKQVTVNTF